MSHRKKSYWMKLIREGVESHSISETCRLCGSSHSVTVNPKKYVQWKSGKGFIQDLFPELSEDARELLISHTCGNCFDKLFPREYYRDPK